MDDMGEADDDYGEEEVVSIVAGQRNEHRLGKGGSPPSPPHHHSDSPPSPPQQHCRRRRHCDTPGPPSPGPPSPPQHCRRRRNCDNRGPPSPGPPSPVPPGQASGDYIVTQKVQCAEGDALLHEFLLDDYTLKDCIKLCNKYYKYDRPCNAFVWYSKRKSTARCKMYSKCTKLASTSTNKHCLGCPFTFYNSTAQKTPLSPGPGIPPAPAPMPPMPAGCTSSHEIKQNKLHISTVCLPEKVSGGVTTHMEQSLGYFMSQVPDKTSSDTIYFSWTADREWGHSDSKGMDGRIYITKVQMRHSEPATLVKSTPFDGFMRTGGIDISDGGVVGTLCTKYLPAWKDVWLKVNPKLKSKTPMVLAMCEVHSSDMGKTGIPWQVGKNLEGSMKLIGDRHTPPENGIDYVHNEFAGFWGMVPMTMWSALKSCGNGLLAYASSSNTWTAWYGDNTIEHIGYAIHTYVADGKVLGPKDPVYDFLKNPIPTDQARLKFQLLDVGGDGTKGNPKGFEENGDQGTGDHQAGTAMRYHPLLKDIGQLKHQDGFNVFMSMHGLTPPTGKFITADTKGEWWINGVCGPDSHKDKCGRLQLTGEYGNVLQEGAMRPCDRGWIIAAVGSSHADNVNDKGTVAETICLKIGEGGELIKKTVIDTNQYVLQKDLNFGPGMARIAPLGTSEQTAKCGPDARFLFGYETVETDKHHEGKAWNLNRLGLFVVEVDGDCNVKQDTKLDVTADTRWQPHQEWSTTIDGAVFWVSVWDEDPKDDYANQEGAKRPTSGQPLYGKTPGATNKARITTYYP